MNSPTGSRRMRPEIASWKKRRAKLTSSSKGRGRQRALGSPVPEDHYRLALGDPDSSTGEIALKDAHFSDEAYARSTAGGDSATKTDARGAQANGGASTSTAMADA
ncbi:hypothetical protein D1007_50280 [Hordeum vulgare]|nr:hypothetical protein D1007_50280 [Hordeum vulgare]